MTPKIHPGMGVEELASVVSEALRAHGILAVLTGGAVVAIYSDGEHQSKDLDYISHATAKSLEAALSTLGFEKRGKEFHHLDTKYFVEFPSGPLAIGGRHVKEWATRGALSLLRPTECVMDRLAAFYHWKDRKALAQALMVARRQTIDLAEIERWSSEEGMTEKFEVFRKRLSEGK